MTADHPPLSPQQAREQLDTIWTPSLGIPGDRKVHAIGAAAVGLTLGLHMATRNVVSDNHYALLSGVFICIMVAEVLWVEKVSRTVPRRARRSFWTGVATSFVVALTVVTPWLNLQAQDGPNTWLMVLLGAALVAVPSLVAAAVIARPRP